MHTNSRQSSGVARIQRRWGKGVVLASRFRCLLRQNLQNLVISTQQLKSIYLRESCTHALPRNIKCLTVDGRVYFHRWLFTNAEP